jgi:hypothetical protein
MSNRPLTDWEIVDLFDTTNITIRELSLITGRSVKALNRLLMGV